jgi:rhodanese-related sulfurtransferase
VKRPNQVPASSWEDWVKATDGLVLDVREPHEWALGTLPGAVTMRMGEVIDRIDELPRDRPILCVCRSGSRSLQVAAYLTMLGFEGATNMSGGMKALGMQG